MSAAPRPRWSASALALKMKLLNVGWRHTQEVGNLRQRERAQTFNGVGRIMLKAEHVQLVRDQFSLLENDLVEAETVHLVDSCRYIHRCHSRNNAFPCELALQAGIMPDSLLAAMFFKLMKS